MSGKKKIGWFEYLDTVTCSNPAVVCAKIAAVVLSKRDYVVTSQTESNHMELIPVKKSFTEHFRKFLLPNIAIDIEEKEGKTSICFDCKLITTVQIIAYLLVAAGAAFAAWRLVLGFMAGAFSFGTIFPVFIPVAIRIFIKSSLTASSKLLISDISRVLD